MSLQIKMSSRKKFEEKDPLWISFHSLFDKMLGKKISFEEVITEMIKLSRLFLDKYEKEEDLREVIIAFENLKINLLVKYGDREEYESSKLKEILPYFDSLIFEKDYKKEVNELKTNINKYLEK